ncbi:MAG: hypothetical protein H0V80_16575 [Acidobacteria bacterium]|nr:hypothetical protein [Acidobacteriota bacterium]
MTTVSFMQAIGPFGAATVYLAIVGLLAGAARPVRAQSILIDRLVAVIGEQALTWRDVASARLLGSIPSTGTEADAIDHLVTRELMHLEVERLAVAAPIAAAVDDRLRRARLRAGSDAAWLQGLRSAGLTAESARAWVGDDLRMDVYVDQRFTAAAQPTDFEVTQEARRVAPPAARDWAAPPAAAADVSMEQLQDARRRLVDQRRAALVADWIAGIRARTPVQLTGARP